MDPAACMARALRLAARGRGRVEPNPMVGAVLARAGRVVGEGWHRRFGGVHAEVEAIRKAGGKARGGTLFVTLEPCAHQGKTPPCVEALKAAGIRKVVAAMGDPHPLVSGKGFAALRKMEIFAETGLMADEARRLNAPFLTLVGLGRPFVTAKWAMSVDGKIATPSGDSKWITSSPARDLARKMRGLSDAVVVGVGTVLADNPMLMALSPRRIPVRVVVDSGGRTPPGSALARTARQGPVLIASLQDSKPLRESGCEVWVGPPSGDGKVDLKALMAELGRRKMTNVFVEGGGRLLGSFFETGLVDRVLAFVAPQVIGGEKALTPVEGAGAPTVERAFRLRWTRVRRVGGDLMMEGDVMREKPREGAKP